MESIEFGAVSPEKVAKASRQDRNALVFLSNFLKSRAEIEQSYAKSLQQWHEKQKFILQKDGNDKVRLDAEILDILQLFLDGSRVTYENHDGVHDRTLRGPQSSLLKVIQHHDNIEQILEEYQSLYDCHMRLVDHSRKSAKKLKKVMENHHKLSKQLSEERAKVTYGNERQLKKIDSRLTDSEASLNLAKTKSDSHTKREQGRRDEFLSGVNKYVNLLTQFRSEESREALEQLVGMIKIYTSLCDNGQKCRNLLTKALHSAETVDIRVMVGRWEKDISENITFPRYELQFDEPSLEDRSLADTPPIDILGSSSDQPESGACEDQFERELSSSRGSLFSRSGASRPRPGAAKVRSPRTPSSPLTLADMEGKAHSSPSTNQQKTLPCSLSLNGTRSMCQNAFTSAMTTAHTFDKKLTEQFGDKEAAWKKDLNRIIASMTSLNMGLEEVISTKASRDECRAVPIVADAWCLQKKDTTATADLTSEGADSLTIVEQFIEPDMSDDELSAGPSKCQQLRNARKKQMN